MLPVPPVLLPASLCPELSDFFLFTDFRFRRLPLQLLLVVIVNIHCQAHKNHDADRHRTDINPIGNNVPHGKCNRYAK